MEQTKIYFLIFLLIAPTCCRLFSPPVYRGMYDSDEDDTDMNALSDNEFYYHYFFRSEDNDISRMAFRILSRLDEKARGIKPRHAWRMLY